MTLLARLRATLRRTRDQILGRIQGTPQEIEEALLAADVGVRGTKFLLERLRQRGGDPRTALQLEIAKLLCCPPASNSQGQGAQQPGPRVVMLVGVNGSGKTTTIGKLAARYRQQGKTVLVAASDTYREAAAPQLRIWAERASSEIVFSEQGQDAAAVAFDAIRRAQSRQLDIVLVDTAGRLHTRKDLMQEVTKIKRACGKAQQGAPNEIWLVLDATVGQTGIAQARNFHEALGLTGMIITKLDGTAKGGIVVAISLELGLPVRYVGIGEGLDDLAEFNPKEFAQALLGPGED